MNTSYIIQFHSKSRMGIGECVIHLLHLFIK